MARILFRSKDFSETKRLVKPRAFMPHKGELSVAELTGLEGMDVLELVQVVEEHRGLTSKGRGELTVEAVERTGLRFDRDDHPYDRHGNLLGWPVGPVEKARALSIAQELSASAKFVLHA